MPDASELVLDILKEQDFLIESTEQEVVITGTEFLLPPLQPEMWAKRNVTIRAQNLRLSQDIIAPGKIVTIVCRTLDVALPATIDVSGKEADAHHGAAINGRTPGAAGAAGLAGMVGADAGKITILAERITGALLTCKANGGKGGAGQAGGNGAVGANGATAGDRKSPRQRGYHDGLQGGTGGTGGAAGRGGNGGKGGNGGTILINSISPVEPGNIHAEAQAGAPGQPGKNGQPGTGGQGGRGGRGWYCEHEPNEPPGSF